MYLTTPVSANLESLRVGVKYSAILRPSDLALLNMFCIAMSAAQYKSDSDVLFV